MSRALWFVAGVATSAYAMAKARRAAEAVTPEGIRDRLAGLSRGAQLFTEEVRTEAEAKERDLRGRLGLTDDRPANLDGRTAPHLQLTRKGNT